jgi:hypothetical protein
MDNFDAKLKDEPVLFIRMDYGSHRNDSYSLKEFIRNYGINAVTVPTTDLTVGTLLVFSEHEKKFFPVGNLKQIFPEYFNKHEFKQQITQPIVARLPSTYVERYLGELLPIRSTAVPFFEFSQKEYLDYHFFDVEYDVVDSVLMRLDSNEKIADLLRFMGYPLFIVAKLVNSSSLTVGTDEMSLGNIMKNVENMNKSILFGSDVEVQFEPGSQNLKFKFPGKKMTIGAYLQILQHRMIGKEVEFYSVPLAGESDKVYLPFPSVPQAEIGHPQTYQGIESKGDGLGINLSSKDATDTSYECKVDKPKVLSPERPRSRARPRMLLNRKVGGPVGSGFFDKIKKAFIGSAKQPDYPKSRDIKGRKAGGTELNSINIKPQDRVVNVWIDNHSPKEPLLPGNFYELGLNIGYIKQNTVLSVGSPSIEELSKKIGKILLTVCLTSHDFEIQDRVKDLLLPPNGETKALFFTIRSKKEGSNEIKVFFYYKMNFLQVLSVPLMVKKSNLKATPTESNTRRNLPVKVLTSAKGGFGDIVKIERSK